ncbi:unnamed protein product [Boreogadus saida]
MLALSTSLQQAAVESSTQDLSDASLEAFALMSRELGCVMSRLATRLGLKSRCLKPKVRLPPGDAPSHTLIQRETRSYVGLGGPPSSPLITFAPFARAASGHGVSPVPLQSRQRLGGQALGPRGRSSAVFPSPF